MKDLTGQTFGRLTVVDLAGITDQGKYRWQCVCQCGGQTTTTSDMLRGGRTQSCGCIRRDLIRNLRLGTGHQPAIGQRFGWLVITGLAGWDQNSKLLVDCRCDCGAATTTIWANVRINRTKSCGCQRYTGHLRRNTGPAVTHPWRQGALA